MIDDKDSVQLSEYCFNVCEVLKTAVQGRNADSLDESVRVALEDLERGRRHLNDAIGNASGVLAFFRPATPDLLPGTHTTLDL